jgi:hypothetical protein
MLNLDLNLNLNLTLNLELLASTFKGYHWQLIL